MKEKILILLLALASALPLLADEGSVAFPFLRVNQDPRSAAMGEVSLYTNPAATVWLEGNGAAGLSWQSWKPGPSTFLSAGGYGIIAKRFGIKASFSKQSETPYDLVDENAQPAGSFTPGALRADFGFSAKLTDKLSAGVNAVYASRTLAADSRTSAFAADLALMGVFGPFQLAGGARLLGGKTLSASGDGFALPASAFLCSGYLLAFAEKNTLQAALEAEYFFYGAPAVQAGLEYGWNHLLYARAGYHYGGLIPSHASAGLGLDLKGFCIDFSYLFGAGDINGSLLIGASYRF